MSNCSMCCMYGLSKVKLSKFNCEVNVLQVNNRERKIKNLPEIIFGRPRSSRKPYAGSELEVE